MDKMNRYEAAAKAGLVFTGHFVGELPLFVGTPEQFARFHELLETPTLV